VSLGSLIRVGPALPLCFFFFLCVRLGSFRIKELQRQGNPSIVIALSGNKLDLAEQRQVETEEAKAYADENGILFVETSAKTNHMVNEMFKVRIACENQNIYNNANRRAGALLWRGFSRIVSFFLRLRFSCPFPDDRREASQERDGCWRRGGRPKRKHCHQPRGRQRGQGEEGRMLLRNQSAAEKSVSTGTLVCPSHSPPLLSSSHTFPRPTPPPTLLLYSTPPPPLSLPRAFIAAAHASF